ncbi:MAG: hypothetical protein NZ769_04640 [Anaerolineae bacterium]|nr:hypothetical protein [Anaerolineae bacterium]
MKRVACFVLRIPFATCDLLQVTGHYVDTWNRPSEPLPLRLSGRLTARDGAPVLLVERLNDIPLVGVGGILSEGINRGLRQAWSASPVRMTKMTIQEDRIITEYR